MQFSQHKVMRVLLAELTKRRLEVIGLHGHVVVVRGRCALHLVEPCLAIRIRTTMIHIIAQEIGAAAEFHDGHGVGILRIDKRPAVVGCHHASTQFTSEIGILLVALVQFFPLFAQLLGCDGCRGTERAEVERLVIVARSLLERALPEAVGIVAIERNHLAEGHW